MSATSGSTCHSTCRAESRQYGFAKRDGCSRPHRWASSEPGCRSLAHFSQGANDQFGIANPLHRIAVSLALLLPPQRAEQQSHQQVAYDQEQERHLKYICRSLRQTRHNRGIQCCRRCCLNYRLPRFPNSATACFCIFALFSFSRCVITSLFSKNSIPLSSKFGLSILQP